MRQSLVPLLACPDDGNELAIAGGGVREAGEILEGSLTCGACGRRYPILNGVPSLLPRELASLADRPVPVGASETGDQINEMRARDELAEGYDYERTPHQDRVEVEATLERLDLGPSDLLLDAGAGPGRFVHPLAHRCGTIVAVDFSMASLQILTRRLDAHGRDVVHAVQGDLLHLPLRAGVFDKCLSFAVLEHVPSRASKQQAVHELRRVLRPAGRLLISTYNLNYYRRRRRSQVGYHGGRIYYETLTRDEFLRMLRPEFGVEGVWGVYNRLPKGLNERLGRLGYWLDRRLEPTPLSNLFSYYLLARCVKESSHVCGGDASGSD